VEKKHGQQVGQREKNVRKNRRNAVAAFSNLIYHSIVATKEPMVNPAQFY
jgi:hypothetical protein